VYLTRFRFNPARRGARELLDSPQALHAAVLAGFVRPEDHTTDTARTLWRVDRGAHRPDVQLYISSPTPPDLTHLVEQAGWPTIDTWLTRPYAPFVESLEKGQVWAFRLTANPVHNGRKQSDSKDTQRFGAVTVQQQVAWLQSRAERSGFTICSTSDKFANLVVRDRQTRTFRRNRGERPVTLAMATYEGVLQVEDAEQFRRVLTRGLGHGRAYGCGLMTLAPAT
jgi:CRISPR system Cascade subunit CasE